tara:strand:- start:730 stop:1104 length:375 start_codon:yes stop_codon:yes gene_type:complete
LGIFKELLIHFNGVYVLNSYTFEKIKYVTIFFLWLPFSLSPLQADESRDHIIIDKIVMSCYEEVKFCNKALSKINAFQKNAAVNNKFSCQTRLLGLEANLIMAMNYNFKKKDARSIIAAIKKYC